MQYLQLEFIIHKKELMRKKLLASLFILSTFFGLYELNNKAFGFTMPNKDLQNIEKKFKIPSQTNKVNLIANATIEDYLTEIIKQFDRKRYKAVLELANKAIELDPEGEKIHAVYYYRQKSNLELGSIEGNTEYFKASLEDNKSIRKLAPSDSIFVKFSYINDIVTYQYLNDDENLKNSAQTALNKFKNDALVHNSICQVYNLKELYQEAIKVCDRAIALDPKDTGSLLVRASIKFDEFGDKEGGCYDLKQASLLGEKKSKKLYSQFCATPREQAKEECNNLENMLAMGMNPAAIVQGAAVMSGGDPKVMEKLRIMRSMCPDVFVERTPSGFFNNNNY